MKFAGVLPSRSLLHIHGRDAQGFLHGLFTHNVKALAPGAAMYGCFLNRQGRVLFDAILAQPSAGAPFASAASDSFVLEVDSRVVDGLAEHLEDFKLRSKYKIADVTEEFATVVASASEGAASSGSFSDPRVPLRPLITRSYVDRRDIASDAAADATADYAAVLCDAGVAEGADIFVEGKTFPFQCNLDLVDGVSFHKGCYLGQELTHRTHVMLVTRKRLVPVASQNEDVPLRIGATLHVGGAGTRAAGTVVATSAAAPTKAVAMLRLAPFAATYTEAVPTASLDCVMTTAEGARMSTPVTARIPPWWDREAIKKVFAEDSNAAAAATH